MDQALGDVLGGLVRSRVLIQILAQGFHAHVAAVRHQTGDGGVGLVDRELHARFHLRHQRDHGGGILALVLVAVEQLLNLTAQLFVFVLVVGERFFQLFRVNVAQNVLDGVHAHLHACVAFPEQPDGVLFNHVLFLLVRSCALVFCLVFPGDASVYDGIADR